MNGKCRFVLHLFSVAIMLPLANCSSTSWQEPAPAMNEQAARVDLPRSKRGNPPFYEVYGKRYTVMQSSTGYKEQGVASWYGKKFHGRDTSSGERYDMYAMTAAHKTLPLPTNVRVTNLATGKSIVVRVNDRGPFVKNRLIDLSYAAAQALDVVAHGTAVVEVTALGSNVSKPTVTTAKRLNTAPAAGQTAATGGIRMYLQVGAFGDKNNARNLASRLSSNGIKDVRVHEINGEMPKLYRVRIGPLQNVGEYDKVSQQVEGLQISGSHLVVESDAPDSQRLSSTAIGGG